MNPGEEKHTVGELYAVAARLVEKELTKYNKKKLSPAEKLKAELIGKVLSQYALKDSGRS